MDFHEDRYAGRGLGGERGVSCLACAGSPSRPPEVSRAPACWTEMTSKASDFPPEVSFPHHLPLNFSLRRVPVSAELLKSCGLPLTAVATPFVPDPQPRAQRSQERLERALFAQAAAGDEETPAQRGILTVAKIPRCEAPHCRAFYGRLCRTVGRKWRCFMCGHLNMFENVAGSMVAEQLLREESQNLVDLVYEVKEPRPTSRQEPSAAAPT
eukprot:scaffold764_cov248-Pinguiococcus_pyrenoidosus.AAC.41